MVRQLAKPIFYWVLLPFFNIINLYILIGGKMHLIWTYIFFSLPRNKLFVISPKIFIRNWRFSGLNVSFKQPWRLYSTFLKLNTVLFGLLKIILKKFDPNLIIIWTLNFFFFFKTFFWRWADFYEFWCTQMAKYNVGNIEKVKKKV